MMKTRRGGGVGYRAVAAEIRGQIRRGELAPGDPLPSLTLLAERHGVAYGTAVRAVRLLVDGGLVATRPRGGSWVAEDIRPEDLGTE